MSKPGGTWRQLACWMSAASLLQTLHVRGIPVQYWGPDAAGNQVRLAAPTLADFQAAAAWTLQAWPVASKADIGLAGTFTWSNPLTGNLFQGACPTSWNNLLFWLRVAKIIDGDRSGRFYYALLPSGIPVGNTGGCGGGVPVPGPDSWEEAKLWHTSWVMCWDHRTRLAVW